MKKILLNSILSVCFLSSYAQVTDTLGYAEYVLGTETLYSSPNGGYAFGNNGYGDKAKAQTYSDTNSFVLREVLLIFGDVVFESQDSSSMIRVNIYDNYGEGVTSAGVSDSIAPDSVLAFVDVPVYELMDDGSFSQADFSSSDLVIFNRFSVGIDFTLLSIGDTVGLMSTTDGDAGGTLNAWELTANDVWFTVEESAYSWGLDVDLAIFPVIDENDPAGVSEKEELKWSFYPNPSTETVWLSTESRDQWDIVVHDMLGKIVYTDSFFGENKEVNVEGFGNGVFLLSISNEKWTSWQRLVVN